MKIKIYCSKCNKYEIIESIEEENNGENKESAFLSIPVPQSSGLQTYSVVHTDHILIVDVDANGDVRKETIINRVGQKLEKVLAALAENILHNVSSYPEENVTFVFLTNSKNMEKVMLGVFQQLLFNITDDLTGILSVAHHKMVFEFGNMTIFVGNYNKTIDNLISENNVIIHHLTSSNFRKLSNDMKKTIKMSDNADYILLFDETVIDKDSGKNNMNKIITKLNPDAVFGVSTPPHIANILNRIVDMFYPRKYL
jgi:hypothetical protein